jgi:hypothetical protein
MSSVRRDRGLRIVYPEGDRGRFGRRGVFRAKGWRRYTLCYLPGVLGGGIRYRRRPLRVLRTRGRTQVCELQYAYSAGRVGQLAALRLVRPHDVQGRLTRPCSLCDSGTLVSRATSARLSRFALSDGEDTNLSNLSTDEVRAVCSPSPAKVRPVELPNAMTAAEEWSRRVRLNETARQ